MIVAQKNFPQHLRPGCHPDCMACQHRHMSEKESLAQKMAFLQHKLYPWSYRLCAPLTLHGEARWAYRRKTTLGVAFLNDRWQWGLWRGQALLHIPNCPIHHPLVNEWVMQIMQSLPNYDFGLRWAVVSGAQVCLVVKSRHRVLQNWPFPDLSEKLRNMGLEGLWLHLNPSTGRKIFGKGEWHLLWGKSLSKDAFGLSYGPAAFSQLIAQLYQQALNEALTFLQPCANTAVVDLYSGTGSSMQVWLKAGASVIGVEASPESARLAQQNLPQSQVLIGPCRQRLPQIDQWCQHKTSQGSKLLIYANPPRKGLESEVSGWIVNKARPLRMAYLSCSPGTLARDLKIFDQHGFKVVKLIPFDFFPQTHHIETLALIENMN